MSRHEIAAVLAGLVLLSACGGTSGAAPRSPAAHGAAAPAPSPPAAPAPAAVPFTGTVIRVPGTPVRFGPGLDMPVVDVEAAGSADRFDGWFQEPDDPSRASMWYHLADGRGWVSSATVQGAPPPGAAESLWTRPATLPAPAAGLLDIALHLQEQRATCEVAALQMALAGRGIAAGERTLLGYTGIDRRPPELAAGGAIARWGDPDQGFVGDPDGSPDAHTGYGVYAAPIARAAQRSGATVQASGTGVAPSTVYAAVMAGRPAVAWVTNDYQRDPLLTWQAWDGARVGYSLHEHAVTVIGVTPTQVLLDDPWFGQRWHSRAEFEAAYATFGGMAVILA